MHPIPNEDKVIFAMFCNGTLKCKLGTLTRFARYDMMANRWDLVEHATVHCNDEETYIL